MQWHDKGIILKVRTYNEEQLILSLFTKEHGLAKAMVTVNNRNRNHLQIGNAVSVTWRGRLEQQLGFFNFELDKSLSVAILQDKLKLYSIYSLSSTLNDCLSERHQEEKLYILLNEYLENLKTHDSWLHLLINYELCLLQELGYSLCFGICSVSGDKENLYYISPKTGKVVSYIVGEPYKEKLFLLPEYFKNFAINTGIEITSDYLNCLEITNFFINKFFPISQETLLIRNRLLSNIKLLC